MNHILRNIFYISYILTFTYIYGNLIVLLMNKIAKEKLSSSSLIHNNNTTTSNFNTFNNLKIHYPTMIILLDDNNANLNM
jgi:hypothetical protein